MIDLGKVDEVKALQANLRCLDSPQGKEVMKFLEQICGWYDFSEKDVNQILINTGKRQIVSTLKTLMKLDPQQVVYLMKGEL